MILFCEFNSRFLIPFPTNTLVTEEAYEEREGRMLSREFVPVIEMLAKERTIKKLVGDADKVFLSQTVKETLDRLGIKYEFLPAEHYDHIPTSVLDRAVRTLRDMLFNLKLDYITPNDLRKVCHIYNNTRHDSITKILGFPATPQMLHKDPSLQLLLIRRLRSSNWIKTQKRGFVIPDGTPVFVRAHYGTFEKHRAEVLPDTYRVVDHKGARYRVKNNKDEILVVPRRDLKVRNTSET